MRLAAVRLAASEPHRGDQRERRDEGRRDDGDGVFGPRAALSVSHCCATIIHHNKPGYECVGYGFNYSDAW